MKNTVKKSLLCLGIVSALGVIASTEAMAQDAGFFVSGQVGASRYDISGSGKERATAAGVGIGYNFNPMVGLELGYNDYGTAKSKNFNLEGSAKSTQLSVLLSGPIGNEWSVYGRLGAASTERKASGFGASSTDRKTEAVYGVGFGYNFAKNIKGTLEYQKVGSTSGDGTGVDALMAGVKVNF